MRSLVFLDSGIGGVGILRAARQYADDCIYFADDENMPYGNKSAEEIYAALVSAVEKIGADNISALVLACNTATAVGIAPLRECYPFPIVGVEPPLRPAEKHAEGKNGKILLLATERTIKEKYEAAEKGGKVIYFAPRALASVIENNYFDVGAVERAVKEIAASQSEKLSAVALGCTHYSLVKPIFERVFDDVPVFDSVEGVAKRIAEVAKRPKSAYPCVRVCCSSGRAQKENYIKRVILDIFSRY